ncbi:hypothetical protein LDENG_00211580 [Lucifuga dentata]|nr:hypothetical protein LDENG_00211580 [Lucifuga dentata]
MLVIGGAEGREVCTAGVTCCCCSQMFSVKALTEANNTDIHHSIQDLPRAHESSEVWSCLNELSSRSLSGEVDNLNHNSSDHDSDSGSEDAEDVSHIAITDDDSEAWAPLSGQQSLSGAEVSSLHADCGEFTARYPTSPLLFEDESSTECDLHFSDLPNLSPASESSNNLTPDNLDGSVGVIARPILQKMTQFNGQYGRSFCLHPGE